MIYLTVNWNPSHTLQKGERKSSSNWRFFLNSFVDGARGSNKYRYMAGDEFCNYTRLGAYFCGIRLRAWPLKYKTDSY